MNKIGIFLAFVCGSVSIANAATLASNGSSSDVQAKINAANNGDTITLPAGTFVWSSGVSIAGNKHVTLQGAGCHYILGCSRGQVSVGTGTKAFSGVRFTLGSYTGQTVSPGDLIKAGWKADNNAYMIGTVNSYSGGVLSLNVTSSGTSEYAGPPTNAGTTHNDWYFETVPSSKTTIQVNNPNVSESSSLINITESTVGNIIITGINFTFGNTGSDRIFLISPSWPNGLPVVVHDCSFTSTHKNRGGAYFWWNSMKGVVYRCSFDSGWDSGGWNPAVGNNINFPSYLPDSFRFDVTAANSDAWTTASRLGSSDTDGTRNFYIENCYFGGQWRSIGDAENNCRIVMRHSVADNSSWVSHGWEHVDVNGLRSAEMYGNQFIFNRMGGGDLLSYPMSWFFFIRGGTLIVTGNVIDDLTSSAYGNKVEWLGWLLRSENALSVPCAGSGPNDSGTFAEKAPGSGYNGSAHGYDAMAFWNNTDVNGSSFNGQYGTQGSPGNCGGPVGSYFVTSPQSYSIGTAKSGYTKFTYPHPLAGGDPPGPDTSPPAIVTAPASLTVQAGDPAQFTVTASGANPKTQLWRTNGIVIAGATASSYTIASTVTAQSGWQFTVIVNNAYGSVTSSVATLTVNAPSMDPPSVTVPPASISRTVGQSASFSVTATGDLPLSYQWQTNAVNVTGETLSTYSIPSVVIAMNGWQVRCVVQNSHGSDTSSAATLTVNAAPVAGLRYVDFDGGNDANPGTITMPWKWCPGMTNWTGQAILSPGDVVYFDRADTWTVPANGGGPGLDVIGGVHYIGDEWDPETAGPGRATIQAGGLQGAGMVRFWQNNDTYPTWVEGFNVDGAGYRNDGVGFNYPFWTSGMIDGIKRVEDCHVYGGTGNGSEGDYKYGIIASDNSPNGEGAVRYVEIIGCTVTNTPRDAIAIYPGPLGGVSDVTVRQNTVWGLATDPSYSEGHGIVIKGHVKNVIAEYNYVHDVEASAVFIDGSEYYGQTVNNGPSNVVVRFNILGVLPTSNDGVIRGFTPSANPGTGSKVDVYGNIVLPNSVTGGFSLGGMKGTNHHWRVYNNTFWNARVDIGNPSLTSSTIDFQNNLMFQTNAVPYTDSGLDVTTRGYNLYFRTDTGNTLVAIGGTNYVSLSGIEPTAQDGNPLFANTNSPPTGFTGTYGSTITPNTTGLSLGDGSPAINAGFTLANDFVGAMSVIKRPNAGQPGWDIGAYEREPFMEPSGASPPRKARRVVVLIHE